MRGSHPPCHVLAAQFHVHCYCAGGSAYPAQSAVWVVNKFNCAERRPVTLGTYQSNGVQVIDGLQEGDKLVVSGYQKLYHHAPVISQ